MNAGSSWNTPSILEAGQVSVDCVGDIFSDAHCKRIVEFVKLVAAEDLRIFDTVAINIDDFLSVPSGRGLKENKIIGAIDVVHEER